MYIYIYMGVTNQLIAGQHHRNKKSVVYSSTLPLRILIKWLLHCRLLHTCIATVRYLTQNMFAPLVRISPILVSGFYPQLYIYIKGMSPHVSYHRYIY